jgi:hypothetical protein
MKSNFNYWFETKAPEQFKELFEKTTEDDGIMLEVCFDDFAEMVVDDAMRYYEREIDFAYLAGVFNVSGIDGLQGEIERLRGLGKNPHDIIIAAREQ